MAFSPLSLLLRTLPIVAGLLIPAYATVASIESPGTQDDTQYLIYWLLYSAVSLVEFVFWPVLKYLGALYALLKTGVLLWLVLPQTKGATYVYEAVLRPSLKKAGEEARKARSDFLHLSTDHPAAAFGRLYHISCHSKFSYRHVHAAVMFGLAWFAPNQHPLAHQVKMPNCTSCFSALLGAGNPCLHHS